MLGYINFLHYNLSLRVKTTQSALVRRRRLLMFEGNNSKCRILWGVTLPLNESDFPFRFGKPFQNGIMFVLLWFALHDEFSQKMKLVLCMKYEMEMTYLVSRL